ncbi:sigma factor-like helix-turn-helix DNA-binding protein [Paenibacillus sp. OV219]|uniref:sigma factor-like helix-turn-helix DNA-binding protein n=1 Tax=Paenibacillus sp. OV219 TaxID=1884377 RepID=UPI00352748B0
MRGEADDWIILKQSRSGFGAERNKEIGDILNLTERSIKSRLHRAREKLLCRATLGGFWSNRAPPINGF